MQLIKVGAAALNQTPLDWEHNRDNILGAIAAAKEAGVQMLCLPELCVCGYGCEDAFYSAGLRRMAFEVLHEIATETQGIVVSLGLPVLFRNALFNTACLVADGALRGFAAKRALAGEGLHYEPRWFKAWPDGVQESLTLEGATYPLGDLCFDVGGVHVAFEICEDAWVARRAGTQLARQSVDVVFNPSASHFAFGKQETRKRLVLEGSRAAGVTYLYGNLLGNEAGRALYDGGTLIAAGGRLLAAGPRFTYEGFQLTTAVTDLDATRRLQSQQPSFMPALGPGDPHCVPVPFSFPEQQPEPDSVALPDWEFGDYPKEEEFARSVALGLFDYMRKTRSQGFVVSLSGGADSAACACLSALMVELGCSELGVPRFLELAELPADLGADPKSVVNALLTCVYQATVNSSEVTRNAARGVATAVGAQFIELEVDALVSDYLALAEQALGRELTWERDDLALQNIQARVRGPSVWLLANVQRKLLLSTSNRSEAAVGYATMDGDTCGGLCPVAGVDKVFLRRWLRWLESTGAEGLAPLPALRAVNEQAPTAELRPREAAQTDEADLMPYDVLEAIERAAIGEALSPVEVLAQLQLEFADQPREQLVTWIERFFTLWCRNQWKRERYAPSFHVDDKNLDPKTWCRFPILSGGFRRELLALRESVTEP